MSVLEFIRFGNLVYKGGGVKEEIWYKGGKISPECFAEVSVVSSELLRDSSNRCSVIVTGEAVVNFYWVVVVFEYEHLSGH